ncbi:MAG: hypothetical protein P4L74_03950 [Candidatus Doudnabacteria bacterium]|nr:hypothetical protein [Candidatus Doudnabacteria bacterium]
MILYLDTTDFNSVTFAVSPEDSLLGAAPRRLSSGVLGIVRKVYKIDPHRSHETLGFLAKFLKSNKINHDFIKKIVVNKGPGSYTGVRVGVTIAMALGFAWGVPVKAIATNKFVIR